MTPADRGNGDGGGDGLQSTTEEPQRGVKESDKGDIFFENMQKSVDEKPTRSKHGVGSLVCLRLTTSPSKPKLNDINIRLNEDVARHVLQQLERLNIRDDESRGLDGSSNFNIRDSDSESESGVSSCESDSEESVTESPTLPRRIPTFRKRGPNGVFNQFGAHMPSPAVASYSESNQRINLLLNKTRHTCFPQAFPEGACEAQEAQSGVTLSLLPNSSRASEDVLETPGQILEEGKIRCFLLTSPNQKLPELVPNDLTCLSGSSPEHVSTSDYEHVSTSDYGSLPGSPYGTPASVASPGSVPNVRTVVHNLIIEARAQIVDLVGTDPNTLPTQERLSEEKLQKMRYLIRAKPDHDKFLLINERGNSQLTICLAQMAHKVKVFDEHLICAMIDFCSEKKAKLLWYRNIKGETPLLIACGLRSYPTIARHLTQVLIRLGHQFEERYDGAHGNSLLHAMAMRDDRCYPCMREILDLHSKHPINGLDINALNAKGLSPLHLAVLNENSSTETIVLLIRHGANPFLPTANPNYGGNAIHLALRLSTTPTLIIEALLSQAHTRCANLLSAVDPHNETPIKIAVKRVDLGVGDLTRLLQTFHRCGAEVSSAIAYDSLSPGRRKMVREIIDHL